jgi:hypothetical protein
MTNLQLYLAVGLPVIAVLASMVVSLVQISGIRDDVADRISFIGEPLESPGKKEL